MSASSQPPKPVPVVQDFFDEDSATWNDLCTPLDFGNAYGENLQFDQGDPNQGVYWSLTIPPFTRLRAGIIAINTAEQIRFRNHGLLDAGFEYQFSIITKIDDDYYESYLPVNLTIPGAK